jgi:hypothetical protein
VYLTIVCTHTYIYIYIHGNDNSGGWWCMLNTLVSRNSSRGYSTTWSILQWLWEMHDRRSAGVREMKPNDTAKLLTIWGVDTVQYILMSWQKMPRHTMKSLLMSLHMHNTHVTYYIHTHYVFCYHHHVGINPTPNCSVLTPFLCPCFHPSLYTGVADWQ